jgi:hypothetical protein
VLYDLETTGIGRPQDVHICEIAMNAIHSRTQARVSLVRQCRPPSPICKHAVEVHGLCKSQLQQCSPFVATARAIKGWFLPALLERHCSPVIMVAHNGPTYNIVVKGRLYLLRPILFSSLSQESGSITRSYRQSYDGRSSSCLHRSEMTTG